jgi:hypothetical protein
MVNFPVAHMIVAGMKSCVNMAVRHAFLQHKSHHMFLFFCRYVIESINEPVNLTLSQYCH